MILWLHFWSNPYASDLVPVTARANANAYAFTKSFERNPSCIVIFGMAYTHHRAFSFVCCSAYMHKAKSPICCHLCNPVATIVNQLHSTQSYVYIRNNAKTIADIVVCQPLRTTNMTTYNIKTGAREAVERICEAYGFTSRLQLSNYLGMSASALSTRIMRDNFPADLVLLCALETGASIYWLTTGDGVKFDPVASDTKRVSAYKIEGGDMLRQASFICDKAMLPDYKGELKIITDVKTKYFVDIADYQVTDGRFLIEYSGAKSVKDVSLLPGNKLRIDWGKYPIDCEVADVNLLGKVVAIYMVNE
ncbi:phage repressor protein CI [Cronobacter dublinensis]|nr:phage repressor protein CI [Cronobacter dublinensis]